MTRRQPDTQRMKSLLNRDFTSEEFYSEFDEGTSFPQVLADYEKIGGCSETIKFLREQKIL